MRHLAIDVGSFRFVARMEEAAAPKTCAAFLELLPFSNQVIHSRWSGEAVWVPLGEFDTGLGFENHTSDSMNGERGAAAPPRQFRLIRLARLRTLAMFSRAGLPYDSLDPSRRS